LEPSFDLLLFSFLFTTDFDIEDNSHGDDEKENNWDDDCFEEELYEAHVGERGIP
jgi:hypothetical protein